MTEEITNDLIPGHPHPENGKRRLCYAVYGHYADGTRHCLALCNLRPNSADNEVCRRWLKMVMVGHIQCALEDASPEVRERAIDDLQVYIDTARSFSIEPTYL